MRIGRPEEHPWFAGQTRLTFARCGIIDPVSVEDYCAHGGYAGLERALALGDVALVDEIKLSGLRGRGGAGFPTGIKWNTVRLAQADRKYIVCNADEGDGGTFADRMLMEGDPLSLVEGMTIAAVAVGATKGYIYTRAEYPHAIRTMRAAIVAARQAGLLGDDVMGSGHSFDLEVRMVAGAYICGEETSLLESLEGKRGMVRAKPPLPAIEGRFGRPTVVNNVPSLASVPWIMANGAYFPEALLNTPLGYEEMAKAGGRLGHGGVVLFDETVELAQQARFAFEFCAAESCGKCTPCRIGAVRGMEVIDRIVAGIEPTKNFAVLDDLCETMTDASLCAMGGLTPVPVNSALTHFPEDFGRAGRLPPRKPIGFAVAAEQESSMTLIRELDFGTPIRVSESTVTLTIDGQSVTVPTGTSIMAAAASMGTQVPKLRATDSLEPFGSCRLCIVQIEGRRGYPASCTTPAEEGLVVHTQNADIAKRRRGVMELYISDHPLDCLTCSANGDCELQDMAGKVGLREVRYGYDGANHLAAPTDESNPYFTFEASKCIACSRCVRACEDIQGTFALTLEGRGFASKISAGGTDFMGSECVSCGACVQACPTATLNEKAVIALGTPEHSVITTCAYCGVGCSFKAEMKGETVVRMVPYEDGEANAVHSCVKGRFAFGYATHKDRKTKPMIRAAITDPWQEVTWEQAIAHAANEFKRIQGQYGRDSVGGITSSRCTNEETFLVQKLIRGAFGNNNVDTCARVCHSPTGYGLSATLGKGRFMLTEFVPTEERTGALFPLILTTGRILSQYNVGAQTRRTEN